jgi:hypothetical protein
MIARRQEKVMTQRYVVLFALITALGCGGEPVGRICDIGDNGAGLNDNVVGSPSLDCVSRTCLRVTGTTELSATQGLCTAECSADDDCEQVPESPCEGGFTCMIPVVVGDFCCKKLCVCRDYIVIPTDGEIPVPAACIASDENNACCNLEGRSGNAAYPLCP